VTPSNENGPNRKRCSSNSRWEGERVSKKEAPSRPGRPSDLERTRGHRRADRKVRATAADLKGKDKATERERARLQVLARTSRPERRVSTLETGPIHEQEGARASPRGTQTDAEQIENPLGHCRLRGFEGRPIRRPSPANRRRGGRGSAPNNGTKIRKLSTCTG